jgi:hypothetical protein
MRAHVRYGLEEIHTEIVRRFGNPVNGLEKMKRSSTAVWLETGRWRTKATGVRSARRLYLWLAGNHDTDTPCILKDCFDIASAV